MTKILHRNLRGTLPFAASAKGLRITDREGREYIDACGGAAVSCLGHGHPEVLAAMHAQIDRVAYAHTSFFTTEVAEELADTLIADAPAGMSHVYLVSGGSEAMEAALKMARQYFVETGEPERSVFIGRRQSYHGNTLGRARGRRQRMAPAPVRADPHRRGARLAVLRIPRPPPGRVGRGLQRAAGRRARGEDRRSGPGRVIAFVAETVVGATAGAVPPTPGYFRRVREICDRHGILLVADEVMCGMGRTGTLHAIEQEGVVPDLMAIAKGLGGGYQPIGAVLVQGRIIEAFRSGSGLFQHGHTYIGHPVAAAAALAVQKIIKRDGLLEAVRTRGAHFERSLRDALGAHPHVGDIRGRGLFRGVELVEDRATKRPFDPAHRVNAKVKAAAMERGLMVYPMGGTIDGVRGDHVLLAPPFIASEADLDEIVGRLAGAIETGTAALRRAA